MKNLLFTVAIFIATTTLTLSQTEIDLSNLTQNINLGQNCSSSQLPRQFIHYGDANLNGFEINLRNAILTITGNIIGPGEIDGCGQSQLCGVDVIQSDININGVVSCSTLNINTVATENLKVTYDSNTQIITIPNVDFIRIYDLTGRLIKKSELDNISISNIKNEILLLYTNKGTFKFLRKMYS